VLRLSLSQLKQLAGFLWVLCCAGLVHAESVVVVSSERSASYAAAVDAVSSELMIDGNRTLTQLHASEFAAVDVEQLRDARVVIALGTEALKQVLARGLRVPVVAALIPRSGFERMMAADGRRNASEVTVLYLDQPFGRQLDLARLAISGVKNVGVLWGQESVQQRARLTAALQSRGMQERSGEVVDTGAVAQGLKAALDDADVLLAVPDPQVFNSASISSILMATYRARIPVLGFSPAYVRAGALLSIYSTPKQVGTQAASLARSVLNGPSAASSHYPADFTIEVNAHVARSLGLELDAAVLTRKLRQLERKP
jgi:ABC-type uncharacterized transport system substrate-binding protein